MKTIIKRYIILIVLLTASHLLIAQGPPNPPGDPSVIGDPVGGTAPLGDGMLMLVVLAFAYGAWKYRKVWKTYASELTASQEN